MEQKFITEEARIEIDAHIKEHGVFFVAVADICPQCHPEQENQRVFTNIEDGFIYTIGFHELGLPEVFVFVGPDGNGYSEATESELRDNLQCAANFISHIYDGRETFKVDKKIAYRSDDEKQNGLYFVAVSDETEEMGEEPKEHFMSVTCRYYGTTDFKVRVFKLLKIDNLL